MPIDHLVSPALKHVREDWWDDDFTEFLAERLRPRPGNRILDVGCGEGLAEVAIGRLHLSQVQLVAVDESAAKVQQARQETLSHNQRVAFAAADAVRLPFASGSFDSTYCVAVLQYVADIEAAVAELARVTRPNGRVVVVEPDNATRFAYSSTGSGVRTFEAARSLFAALPPGRPGIDARVGPTMPERFIRNGIEPVEVRVFPVVQSYIGVPPDEVWALRRTAMTRAVGMAASPPSDGADSYFELLAAYEQEARAAGASFVEIQSSLLFATVGQRVGN